MTIINDLLNKFNLNLSLTTELKNIEILNCEYNFYQKENEKNKYYFKAKLDEKIRYLITIDLNKMLIYEDTFSDDVDFSTYYVYNKKGEVVEFG